MKIGLVLFGHLRSFRSTHDSFQQFLETLQQSGDVDVFCHTWDIEESVTASWWKEHAEGDIPPVTVNTQEIEEKYKPTKYTIEHSRRFDDSAYRTSSIPVAGILSMLYTQQKAFELLKQYEVENNFQYDIVVKTRYDLLYEIVPGFNRIIAECLKTKNVYLPSSNPYELLGSYSDIFAIGGREEMEKYFSFCSNLKKATEYYEGDGYTPLIPEYCMTVYLDRIGVKSNELHDIRLNILRMNGEKFQVNSDKNFTNNGPLCFYKKTIGLAKEMLCRVQNILDENSNDLVKKYMSWVDVTADKILLEEYAYLYEGNWIEISKIKRLAVKGRANPVFNANVMKNFFEEVMQNGKYGHLKKILLAVTLTFWAGYGTFFFRVLKKTFDRS